MSGIRMNIAVVGSGISGLFSAWLLSQKHDVTLFEKDDRFGSHNHTVDIAHAQNPIPVDTDFIVFNQKTYPNLNALFSRRGKYMKSALYPGVLMHNRIHPKKHRFSYRISFWLIDLDELSELEKQCRFYSRNHFNLISFHDADYGQSNETPLGNQIHQLLIKEGMAPPESIRILWTAFYGPHFMDCHQAPITNGKSHYSHSLGSFKDMI